MNLSLPAKKMMFLIGIITAILLAGGAALCFILPSLFPSDILPISLGILLLALVNFIKVFLLEWQVVKISAMEDASKVKLYTVGQVLIRFILTAGALVGAHFIDTETHLALYAAIISAFAWNIAAYGLKYMNLDPDETAVSKESNVE